MNAIDTNVFVYAIDTSDDEKYQLAVELISHLAMSKPPTLLIWQVACEYVNQLRKRARKNELTLVEVEDMTRRMLNLFPMQYPKEYTLLKSFDLISRYSLSHWDAMLIAACKEAGVTTLYSEDMQDGMDYDGVQIVNPFA